MISSDQSDDPDYGISSFDLGGLSTEARRLVRILLRKPGLSAHQLISLYNQAADSAPLSLQSLEPLLKELESAQALMVSNDQVPLYRINFRRKSMGNRALWNTLDSSHAKHSLIESLDLDALPQKSHRPNLHPAPPPDDDQAVD